jgi:hypothetical protein
MKLLKRSLQDELIAAITQTKIKKVFFFSQVNASERRPAFCQEVRDARGVPLQLLLLACWMA